MSMDCLCYMFVSYWQTCVRQVSITARVPCSYTPLQISALGRRKTEVFQLTKASSDSVHPRLFLYFCFCGFCSRFFSLFKLLYNFLKATIPQESGGINIYPPLENPSQNASSQRFQGLFSSYVKMAEGSLSYRYSLILPLV